MGVALPHDTDRTLAVHLRTLLIQGVIVNGHLSFLALIISGVPQGTVLDPILFLIFINDIDLCIAESIIRSFADDTRVSKPIGREKDVSLL